MYIVARAYLDFVSRSAKNTLSLLAIPDIDLVSLWLLGSVPQLVFNYLGQDCMKRYPSILRWACLGLKKLVRNPVKGFELGIAFLGTTGVIVGLFFAGYQLRDGARSIRQNALSLKLANRVQLYNSDAGLSKMEFEDTNGKLWTLYAKPDTGDATNYCRLLLQLLNTNAAITNVPNAEELYALLGGLSCSPTNPADNLDHLRRAYNYSSQVLDQLHFAYDCWGEGIISSNELGTWIGYIKAIGPHPIFLATICRWHDKNYMCRNFADLLRHELEFDNGGKTNEASCRIIHYFYKEMDDSNFLDTLPYCGEVWHGWSTNAPKQDKRPSND